VPSAQAVRILEARGILSSMMEELPGAALGKEAERASGQEQASKSNA
jgi:hypothetical protein